jgi:hypothetical protein
VFGHSGDIFKFSSESQSLSASRDPNARDDSGPRLTVPGRGRRSHHPTRLRLSMRASESVNQVPATRAAAAVGSSGHWYSESAGMLKSFDLMGSSRGFATRETSSLGSLSVTEAHGPPGSKRISESRARRLGSSESPAGGPHE